MKSHDRRRRVKDDPYAVTPEPRPDQTTNSSDLRRTPGNVTLPELLHREYVKAGDRDRQWFAARPHRRFRLRPAVRAERQAWQETGLPATHVLVEQVQPGHRRRIPVLWTIPGPLPDTDAVLARLLAGAVFGGASGRT